MMEESFLKDFFEKHDEDFVNLDSGPDNDGDNETLVANANHLEQHSVMPELAGDLEADMADVMREEVTSELKQEQLKQE